MSMSETVGPNITKTSLSQLTVQRPFNVRCVYTAGNCPDDIQSEQVGTVLCPPTFCLVWLLQPGVADPDLATLATTVNPCSKPVPPLEVQVADQDKFVKNVTMKYLIGSQKDRKTRMHAHSLTSEGRPVIPTYPAATTAGKHNP